MPRDGFERLSRDATLSERGSIQREPKQQAKAPSFRGTGEVVDSEYAPAYVERSEEQQLRSSGRCKCMFLTVLSLFCVLFFIYAVNSFAQLKTSNTHRYFGPQFQSGWSYQSVSIADAILVSVSIVPMNISTESQIAELQEPYVLTSTTPVSRLMINPIPPIESEYRAETAVKITSSSCVNSGEQPFATASQPPSLPHSDTPMSSTSTDSLPFLSEPRLSGHSIVIGADGLPVFTAVANPFALYVFRCIDIKCTSYQPARLLLTDEPAPHETTPQGSEAAARADGLLGAVSAATRAITGVVSGVMESVRARVLDTDTETSQLAEDAGGVDVGDSEWSESGVVAEPAFSHVQSRLSTRRNKLSTQYAAKPAATGSLTLLAQTRIVIARTGMPLIITVTPDNELYIYRCASYNCREGTVASLLATGVVASSPGVLLAPNGNLLVAYSDALTHAPVLIACADATCTAATKTVLSGVTVSSSARLSMHAAISGDVLISFAGKWGGAVASALSFVSPTITTGMSRTFYQLLQQHGILSNKGVVQASFSNTTDLSFLFEGMSRPAAEITQLEKQVRGALTMLRGPPAEHNNSSDRQVVVLHCQVPACSLGKAQVRLPWAAATNITDVTSVLSARGQALYFAMHRTSSELWGNTFSLSSFLCPYPDCSNNGEAIGGAHAPHAIVTNLASATGRVVARAHPFAAAHTMLMVDQDAVPRVLRCIDDTCSRVAAQSFPYGEAVCTVSTCFDARVNSVDGMPVLAMGSSLHVAHCSNPFCTPYITY